MRVFAPFISRRLIINNPLSTGFIQFFDVYLVPGGWTKHYVARETSRHHFIPYDVALAAKLKRPALDVLTPAYEKLLTVSGIGKILALTIMLETGPIERFADGGKYKEFAREPRFIGLLLISRTDP